MIPRTITERLSAELDDFDLALPEWLDTILRDDVDYAVTVTVTSACAFGMGLVLGWILTL